DQLQNTSLKKKMENKIVAHITHEFSKAGLTLPLPKFRDNMVTYDEPAAAKLANRLRTGAMLFAQVLDEMEVKLDA
ncbi:MAG: hypothetical protein ACTIMQ_14590, partial [Acinetobacter guillouiae]